jgi:DNA polymerase
MLLHLDYESRSLADLPKVGAFRYANDPSTMILCAAIAEGDNKPLIWRCDQTPSKEVVSLLRSVSQNPNDTLIYAHNAQFEFAISEALWEKTFHLPKPQLHQWRCTAAMGRRAALPSSLKRLAEALKLTQQKDDKGGDLIRKFSIPQKKTGKFIEPEDEPEAFQAFVDYCSQDTRVEREIHKKLHSFELTGFPLQTFLLDLKINARGFPVNLDALRKANKLVQKESEKLTKEFRALVGINPTQDKKFKIWLADRGSPLANLKAETLEEILEDEEFDENSEVGRALTLKKRIGFASLKKIKTMLACAGPKDNRVRGTLTYHGAGTGRWSASLVQPQNFKRPATYMESLSGLAYDNIIGGCDSEWLAENYGPPLEVVASCIRHFIQDHRPMLSMDYASIEARLLAWQAGEQWKLDIFNSHGKIYEASACQMFGMQMSEFDEYKKNHGKNHPMRQKAKSGELGCIAEGELVFTDRGLIPIEKISLDMLVWDGIDFVKHEGVIYQGIKEVITYEGLTATKDHIVFTDAGEMQFSNAAKSGSHLIQSRPSRKGIREGKNNISRKKVYSKLVGSLRSGSVPKLSENIMDLSRKPNERNIQRLPKVLKTKKSPAMAGQTCYSYEAALCESSRCGLQKLRGERNKIYVSECSRSLLVDSRESGITSSFRIGSYKQRRELRKREFTFCYSHGAEQEQENFKNTERDVRMGLLEESLHGIHNYAVSKSRENRGRNNLPSKASCHRKKEELDKLREEVSTTRTYDIVNCGPRNRFVVSGVLVHNCGYQGSVGALIKMGALKQGLKEEDLPEIIRQWREANPAITKMWRDIDLASKSAIKNPSKVFTFGRGCSFFTAKTAGMNYLFLKLPSGRKIAYPQPELVPVLYWQEEKIQKIEQEQPDGTKKIITKVLKGAHKKIFNPTPKQIDTIRSKYPKAKLGEAITIFSKIKDSQQWGRVSVYAGSFCNNQIQGIAGDFMALGALNAEAAGYQVYSLIHDEILGAYEPEKGQSPEGLEALMTKLPDWADGMPLAAEGGIVKFYQK